MGCMLGCQSGALWSASVTLLHGFLRSSHTRTPTRVQRFPCCPVQRQCHLLVVLPKHLVMTTARVLQMAWGGLGPDLYLGV